MSDVMSRIESALSEEFYSPYKFAQVVSDVLGREVRPQMIYNYCKKGEKSNAEWTIKATTNNTNKKVISRDEGVRWLSKFVERANNKAQVNS